MRYLVWVKPEFICMLLCYHGFNRSVPVIFSKCNLNFVKVVPHRAAQTERGLRWFKTSFRLPNNSTTNSYSLIPNKEEWSYRKRTISNKQSNKTQHHSSTSTEQVNRQKIMQHLLQAVQPNQHLMVVWINRAIIVLCQGFYYIKNIKVYIVT